MRPCLFPDDIGNCGLGAAGGHVGFRGMAEAVVPGQPVGHVGSRVMPAAVGLGLPPAMMVPGAWSELLARVCRWPCWFPGHGGSCGPGAAGGHFGSRGMAGAVGPGLLPGMLVPMSWQELWARGCYAAMLVSGA